METITFYGTVLPEAKNLTFDFAPTVEWDVEELGLRCCFTVTIKGSKVTAACQTSRFRHEDLPHYLVRVNDIARGLVDLYSFATGTGLSVNLDRYKSNDGIDRIILPQDNRLAQICTAYTTANLIDVARLALCDPAIFMALNDLIIAITLPHHAVVNCARAIEGIRHIIAGAGTDPKKAWPIMQAALNIDEGYLRSITSLSTKPRHGHRVRVAGPDVGMVVARSWNIMDRFFHYSLGGSAPLPANRFPKLVA